MDIKHKITGIAIGHPKTVTWLMVLFTVITGAMIPMIKVDTDPENMLAEDEPVRVFHDENKERFDLSDMVVLGIVNEHDPEGVFNPASLEKVYQLADFAATELQWDDPENPDKSIGVIEADIIAPSMVDHIGQGDSPGFVKFEWLMGKPPYTAEQAAEIKDRVLSNPILKGTLVSEDGKALCLYLPLTSKALSYRVYTALNKKIAEFSGDEEYHITGLPVAEDTFGVEMFIQMAISAPLAMLTIFVLMLLFFRKLVLIISPMIVAMVSVISTMGLLIGFGHPVHIMSSMIPIFLMPIAVVDSVHILSEFFDRYTREKGKKATILEVMDSLFVPMLYTSLTSAAGFLSLALTPIPPVQVFGLFVGIGIMIAWVLTIVFVPAYVMFIKDKSLENFGLAAHHDEKPSVMSNWLHGLGQWVYKGAKPILAVFVVLVGISVYGISRIQINDNPVKWFAPSHPIRVADKVLNDHFGGTYMAYLVLEGSGSDLSVSRLASELKEKVKTEIGTLKGDYPELAKYQAQLVGMIEQAGGAESVDQLFEKINDQIEAVMKGASDVEFDALDEILTFIGLEKERLKLFKRPDVLQYIASLQHYLQDLDVVGKSSSVVDVVKKVNQELIDGKPENYQIPDRLQAVGETLIQYQGSHRPQDLWHLVTPDYDKANIWIQLTSGDNKDMQKVVAAVETFFKKNTPPAPLAHHWAGLTYINVIWQDKMVTGMLQSFMGSFLVVFIMMAILFRSPLWGLLCMIPLTITIAVIYGIIGLIGKDYDMPVAVLSALTLGMAVDFAIHFLERSREAYRQHGNWEAANREMFGEPARAISRNVLVIAIGFLPLLAAPLVPYKTVGIFLCAIMALSGVATMLVLPALIRIMSGWLFKASEKVQTVTCNCGSCLIISIATVALIAINLHQYWNLGVTKLTWISLALVPVLGLICGTLSRRNACKLIDSQKGGIENSSESV